MAVPYIAQIHYVKEDLSVRDFFLENSTPHRFVFNERSLTSNTWGGMIVQISDFLLDLFPEKCRQLDAFRVDWSKARIFSPTPVTNSKPLQCGYHVNVNHTAQHSCWLIQDLMDFFGLDKSKAELWIHRPSGALRETERSAYLNDMTRLFAGYLLKQGIPKNQVAAILDSVKELDAILKNLSKSHVHVLLFDDKRVLPGYLGKIEETIPKVTDNSHTVNRLKGTISILKIFYRDVNTAYASELSDCQP